MVIRLRVTLKRTFCVSESSETEIMSQMEWIPLIRCRTNSAILTTFVIASPIPKSVTFVSNFSSTRILCTYFNTPPTLEALPTLMSELSSQGSLVTDMASEYGLFWGFGLGIGFGVGVFSCYLESSLYFTSSSSYLELWSFSYFLTYVSSFSSFKILDSYEDLSSISFFSYFSLKEFSFSNFSS